MRKQKFVTNSDIKDRQVFEVVKRTERSDVIGIKHEGVSYKFGQGNMFTVSDPGLARAIHDEHGQGGEGHVIVVPVEKRGDHGHTRTFMVPELPWHRKEK